MNDTPSATTPAKAPYVDRRLLVKLDDFWDATDSLRREDRLIFKRITLRRSGGTPREATYIGHLLQIEQVGFEWWPELKGLKEITGLSTGVINDIIKKKLGILNLKFNSQELGIDPWIAEPFTGALPDSLKNEPPVTPEELAEMLKGNFDTGPIGAKAIKATTPGPFGQIDRRLLVPLTRLFDVVGAQPSIRLRTSLNHAKLTRDNNPIAAVTHVLHVYQLGGGINMQENRVIGFGPVCQTELADYLAKIGLDIEKAPAQSAAWASLPFTGELPDALQDQPPVTPEELEAMAKGDYKVTPVAIAESSTSFIDALTEAQRALVTDPVHEVIDPEVLKAAIDIRDTGGIIALDKYEQTALKVIGLALLGLQEEAPTYLMVETTKGSKSVKAVIAKRGTRNIEQLGQARFAPLDKKNEKLIGIINAHQTAPFTTDAESDGFIITADPDALRAMGLGVRRTVVLIPGLHNTK